MFHVKLSERGKQKKKFRIKSSLYHIFPIFFHCSLQPTIATNRTEKNVFFFHEIPFWSSLLFYILSFMKFEVKSIYLLWLRGHIWDFRHILTSAELEFPFFSLFSTNLLTLFSQSINLGESSASAVTSACSQTLGTLYGNLVPLVLYSTLLLMSKMWWWCVTR